MTAAADQYESKPSELALWFGVLTGPIAWAIHLAVTYPLVPVICATGWEFIFDVATIATAVPTIVAGYVSYRAWRRTPPEERTSMVDKAGSRRSFMAYSGLLLNALFLLTIIAEYVPVFFVSPCA